MERRLGGGRGGMVRSYPRLTFPGVAFTRRPRHCALDAVRVFPAGDATASSGRDFKGGPETFLAEATRLARGAFGRPRVE